MIIQFIIQMITGIFQTFLGFFPIVTTLPWGLDSTVSFAIGLFKGFANIFPPITAVFTTFMIYLGFRVALMLFGVVPIFGKMVNAHKKA